MKSTLRGLMFVASSAGLAWACLITPGLALADDTPNPCNALKRIVAAAPDGFTSLRPDDGKAVAQPYGSDAQCAAKAGTYSCTWTKGANAGSAADALQGVAADIAACLPDATHDQNSPGRQHFYIGARGQRTQITATTAGAGKLTLAVSGISFPAFALGMVCRLALRAPGKRVTLAYYLLRRPLATFRAWSGL